MTNFVERYWENITKTSINVSPSSKCGSCPNAFNFKCMADECVYEKRKERIVVENAEDFRTCNCCNGKDNVHNITIFTKGTNQGTQIALCEKCIDVLADKLPKEQKDGTGYWIINEYEYLTCSLCGKSYYTGCESTEEAQTNRKKNAYSYCPYCGKKMTY